MLSPLLLAAGDSLVDRSGLLGLSHDFARQAVDEAYLPNDDSPALSPPSRQMPYADFVPTGSAKIRLRATGWVLGPR
jgi:hypothetical protein